MSEPPAIVVRLQLRAGANPIEGSLAVGDGAPQPFRGWLQLTALLHAASGRRDLPGSEAD